VAPTAVAPGSCTRLPLTGRSWCVCGLRFALCWPSRSWLGAAQPLLHVTAARQLLDVCMCVRGRSTRTTDIDNSLCCCVSDLRPHRSPSASAFECGFGVCPSLRQILMHCALHALSAARTSARASNPTASARLESVVATLHAVLLTAGTIPSQVPAVLLPTQHIAPALLTVCWVFYVTPARGEHGRMYEHVQCVRTLIT
jgi:hypothetical protein